MNSLRSGSVPRSYCFWIELLPLEITGVVVGGGSAGGAGVVGVAPAAVGADEGVEGGV